MTRKPKLTREERAEQRRQYIMQLLADGWMTQSEAAVLAGVSRQCIHQWVQTTRIHPLAARQRHLNKLLEHAGTS